MNTYARPYWLLAAALSALAGFVDALGFIQLGGFFVSFMSGNSTRLGVGLAEAAQSALLALGLVTAFVLGVMAGTLTGHFSRHHRAVTVLALVTVLLALAASCALIGWMPAAIAFMALAMGAENSVFERDGEVSIGLTYMTGTLVRFAQRLTSAFLGGSRVAWLPYLLLWIGLVMGAALGATLYAFFQLASLWVAVAGAAALALVAAQLDRNAITRA